MTVVYCPIQHILEPFAKMAIEATIFLNTNMVTVPFSFVLWKVMTSHEKALFTFICKIAQPSLISTPVRGG